MPNLTLDSLLTRIKKEVQQKEKISATKKLEARTERARRSEPPSTYQRPECWYPVAIHREYESQHCDTCKEDRTAFHRDQIEFHHIYDRSARRIGRDTGQSLSDLPIHIHIKRSVVPQCFCCATVNRIVEHLFSSQHRKVQNARS